jgi:hypothetical protein
MDKLTVFTVVVLIGILRGLLQRRQVKAELEERLAKARTKPSIRRLPGRLPTVGNDESLSTVESDS